MSTWSHRRWAAVTLGVVLALAGCAPGGGGGSVSDDDLVRSVLATVTHVLDVTVTDRDGDVVTTTVRSVRMQEEWAWVVGELRPVLTVAEGDSMRVRADDWRLRQGDEVTVVVAADPEVTDPGDVIGAVELAVDEDGPVLADRVGRRGDVLASTVERGIDLRGAPPAEVVLELARDGRAWADAINAVPADEPRRGSGTPGLLGELRGDDGG